MYTRLQIPSKSKPTTTTVAPVKDAFLAQLLPIDGRYDPVADSRRQRNEHHQEQLAPSHAHHVSPKYGHRMLEGEIIMSCWRVARCFACITLLYSTAQADREEDVTAYLSHLTYVLQKQHSGVFNCWLLEFYNNSTKSSMLNSVSHRLYGQYVSVLQADHQFSYQPTLREPNMVIILWGKQEDSNIFESFYASQWVLNIPSDCPTVVLFVTSNHSAHPRLIGAYLEARMVFYFALIAINEDAIFTFRYGPMRITTHTGFPKHHELFFDRLHTMQIKHFTAAYMKDFYTLSFCDRLLGEDMALFVLFAQMQQLVLDVLEVSCSSTETLGHCLSPYHGIHLFVNRVFLMQYNKYAVSSSTMAQIAIATPKGRLLTVWEMLLKPFQTSAWATILAVLVVVQLIQLCAPTLFTNNMLALALFGFERRKLRLTKYVEKMTATALIIFFFQLKCAYEAKLVSYLTETPRLPDALSIEDLRDRNITVHYRSIPIHNVDKLAGMVAKYDSDRFVYDGITLLANREALVAEKFFADNVEGYGMPYTILPDNVFEILPFYVFSAKSLLRKRFHKYQQQDFFVPWIKSNFAAATI
uniref:Ionotropic glutamate receptor L-glutamate and glycine-binding domain-containing protein n=1 Tax=Anopheles culicifacies TaxID=139723 RepID=A0A182MV13_9DIPT